MEKVDSVCGRERERLVAGLSLRTYNSIPREDLPRISHMILPSRFISERKFQLSIATRWSSTSDGYKVASSQVLWTVGKKLKKRAQKRNSAPAWFPMNPDHSLAFALLSSR